MNERPYATVGGLIFAPDGTILLVQSKKWHDLYSTPGGKIEWGELRENAFRREVWEETGLKVVNLRYVQGQECVFSPEYWTKSHFVMSDYIADLDPSFTKNQVELNEEAYSYCWVTPQEALNLPLQNECKALIEWYLSNSTQQSTYGILGFNQLEIACIIGIYPEERQKKQLIHIDLKVQRNLTKFFQTGSLDDTLDYEKLAHLCSQLAQDKNYLLLETFASDILDQCMQFPGIGWGWVRIKKPSAIPSTAYAFVELERGKKG